MLKLGPSNKIRASISTENGSPKIIAVDRILQGEPVENISGHEMTIIQSRIIFGMSAAFSNCVKVNPIRVAAMNSELDQLLVDMKKRLSDSDELITQEKLNDLPNSPEFMEKFEKYKWLDFLTGFVSLYPLSDYANADIEWNPELKIWQVVATREILPDELISLPKPTL